MTASSAAAAAVAKAAGTAPAFNSKKRLVLTVYRSLLRWCQDIPDATLPLDDFIPPMRTPTQSGGRGDEVVMDNVQVFRKALGNSFREEVTSPQQLTERIQKGLDGMRHLNRLHPEIMAFHRQWGASIRKHQQKQSATTITTTTAGVVPGSTTLKEQDRQKVAAYFDTIGGSDSSTTSAAATYVNGSRDADDTIDNDDDYNERDWVQQKLENVKWLPKIEDCEIRSLELDDESTKFPMFPLASGPLFHADALLTVASADDDDDDDDDDEFAAVLPLPLFTPQRETPVRGAEVPLQVFEPRYRQLYSDLQQSGQRQMIIPFPHPLEVDTFASVAWVHHLTNLQEIADETNGKIQYRADHVVISPIEIEHILNPQVWATQETYLQVQGRYLMEEEEHPTNAASDEGGTYEPLRAALKEWKADSSHPLASKSLLALQEYDRVWDLVHVWNTHFQQELFQLQLAVATQVKRLSNSPSSAPSSAAFVVASEISGNDRGNSTSGFTKEVVAKAQMPHRRRLLQLMMDTSLLVPTLLTMSEAEKCQYLVHLVQQEQKYLKSNSF